MKTILIAILAILLPLAALPQPVPPVAASQAQVNAGAAGWPFVVTPATLSGFPFVATNLSSATMTNVANAKGTIVSNGIVAIWPTTTNLVLFSGSNGPPVVGQTLVIVGTNVNGSLVAKGTNFPDIATASNNFVTSVFNGMTNIVAFTNGPPVAGQALVITSTNAAGVIFMKGTNWPSGGSTPNGLVTNSAGADVVVTNAGVNTTITSNSVTTTTITATTANLTQANVTTAWLTNTVIPTNTFAGTVADLSKGFSSTNLGGNLTFSDVANVTAGAENACIVRLFSGGSDRTIAFPTGWHTNYNFIGVVTNGWQMDLMFTVTAARTNVAQILYP